MKRSNNFNAVAGQAQFKEGTVMSYSARLNFSPDLVYVLPAQVCFAHLLKEPLTFNGNTYDAINSVVMVGVDINNECTPVDLKIVPVSNLTRMYYPTDDVKAVQKNGLWRGATSMECASSFTSAVEVFNGDGRAITAPQAYKVKNQIVYVPQLEANPAGGYDFKVKEDKLDLVEKRVAIFTDFYDLPDCYEKVKEFIQDELQNFLL